MKKNYTYFIIIFLIVSSCIAFGRIARNDFINFDDDTYVTENNYIKTGVNPESIKWAATAVIASNWHPLTWISHMIDWRLFGADAAGHHIVSLLLHIGAVIFLFLFLNKTTNNLWPAAFAAALFALHPLRVESVAWIAERKDVLSMFFGMACLFTYTFYTESSKPSRYFLCLILFMLSLMSKPMLVTLPFVLMLLDYWPLQRWQKDLNESQKGFFSKGRLVWEKVPFICITIASSILTVWAQNKGGAVASFKSLSFIDRADNAIFSYLVYLEKIFCPFNLSFFYPYQYSLPPWKILISGIILVLITFAVIYYLKKLPFLFVGWFWYLGTLIPLIGLVQVGSQAIADRYTYLPSIGIAVMVAWGIQFLIKSAHIRKKILFPTGVIFIITLSLLTWQQCGYWKNSETLFRHALFVSEDNDVAHMNLGLALFAEGKIREAISHYNRAIQIKPNDADFYNNRGVAYANLSQYQLAVEDFNKAIRLSDNIAESYVNRGTIYYNLRQYQRAIEDFNEAIRLRPNCIDAYYKRAFIYLNQGNVKSGCSDAQKACLMGICEILDAAKSKGYCR